MRVNKLLIFSVIEVGRWAISDLSDKVSINMQNWQKHSLNITNFDHNFCRSYFFLSLRVSKLCFKKQGQVPTNSDNQFQNRDKQGQDRGIIDNTVTSMVKTEQARRKQGPDN